MDGGHDRHGHYIPIRVADLVRLLVENDGLEGEQASLFRRWTEIFRATLALEYSRAREDLKDAYAPFDPESTTVDLHAMSADERKKSLSDVFARFEHLAERANFTRLDEAAVAKATTMRSEWGINMEVDFSLFENFGLFVRGEGVGIRARRRWTRFWREEEVQVPIYRRLIVMVKLRPSKRFPKAIDVSDVFLKYFKDIPKADIEMLLPGARVVMPGFQRLKLGGSVVTGLFFLGLNLVKPILTTAILGVNYLYTLVGGLAGYGWKQWAGYQTTRTAISLRLTESLYFQNLANNQAAIFSLLDEAEEQDAREAILAYGCLWRHAGPLGWTAAELDRAIERDIEARIGTPVDFEVDDALAKLERLGLATRHGDRFVPMPIETALEHLDRAWDGQFRYSEAAA